MRANSRAKNSATPVSIFLHATVLFRLAEIQFDVLERRAREGRPNAARRASIRALAIRKTPAITNARTPRLTLASLSVQKTPSYPTWRIHNHSKMVEDEMLSTMSGTMIYRIRRRRRGIGSQRG